MKLTKIAAALVAVLAMSAIVVSAAPAAQFKSSSTPVMLLGEDYGNHKFTVDGQAVTCSKAVFHKNSLATPANTVGEVTATYNNCTAFGFTGALVNMGNCTYDFLQPNEVTANKDFEGNVGLRCNESGHVNIFVKSGAKPFESVCEVWISEANNTNLNRITYQNNANAVTVTAQINTGIQVDKKEDNVFCPLSGTGIVNNGSYNGPTLVEGTGGIRVFVG